MTTIVHLTSSTFFGGPERQLLGLAASLPGRERSVFFSFSEGGLCRAFLTRCRVEGFEAHELSRDTPHLRAAVHELADRLRDLGAGVLCCHGYKADLLGQLAAKRVGVPVIAVSRGWTGESLKVRVYEALDRVALRGMDRVVCVSEGQAAKVRRAGVPTGRVVVIRNAIRPERFGPPDPVDSAFLRSLFPTPVRRLVGAAGRLSVEKGFATLVDAAAAVQAEDSSVGFVLFGEGRLRGDLERRIAAKGLQERFILAGFRNDLDRLLPHLDLLAIPSFTEGLSNVALEALAVGVPVVATAVGGNPEVVDDGRDGYLVPPGDPAALARRIGDALRSDDALREMGRRGRVKVSAQFTFGAQGRSYLRLFDELAQARSHPATVAGTTVRAATVDTVQNGTPQES